MGRLLSFDYTKPFFYMVTLKRKAGLADFSRVTEAADPPKDTRGRPRYLIADDLTMAFAAAIRGFAAKSPGLWPLETFIVMPDKLRFGGFGAVLLGFAGVARRWIPRWMPGGAASGRRPGRASSSLP